MIKQINEKMINPPENEQNEYILEVNIAENCRLIN
mgnify:CR=1 FL=1